jgi:hypothetical protein
LRIKLKQKGGQIHAQKDAKKAKSYYKKLVFFIGLVLDEKELGT